MAPKKPKKTDTTKARQPVGAPTVDYDITGTIVESKRRLVFTDGKSSYVIDRTRTHRAAG